MATKLNRKAPYHEISGHSLARWYQGGKYFDGQGNEVSAEDAARPHNVNRRQLNEIEQEDLQADESTNADVVDDEDTETEAYQTSEAAEPAKEPGPEDPPAAEEDVTEDEVDPEWQQRYEDAKGLHHTALHAMCEELYNQMVADGEADGVPEAPFDGEGSKDKNARWLATHTG